MGVTPTCQLLFSVVRVKRLLANDRTWNIIANDYSSAPFASNRTSLKKVARKTINFPPSLGAYVLTR